jgi:tetratricopeptide (TPR) repeat protein
MRTFRRPLVAAATLALLPAAGIAQHQYHCGAPPPLTASVVPLWKGVAGTVSRPISIRNDSAQAYFNQGLALIYGFNHGEAVLSFRKAARFAPDCAICYWGVATALGPNINEQINEQRWKMAAAAVDTARMLMARASPVERAYIGAARQRYFYPDGTLPRFPLSPSQFTDVRAGMDRRYADAMAGLWQASGGQDLHGGALYVESMMDLHPWDLWKQNGDPKWPETMRTLAVADSILRREPSHVGAAHLKIHILEGSPRPDLAVREAGILEGLMPGSGHITHMPSHIDHRVGSYAEGVGHNVRATALDSAYLAFRGWEWRYPMYYAHDNDFLWVSATFAGMRNDAVRSADALNGIVTDSLIACYASAQHFLTAPVLVRARFGDWDGALRQPRPAPAYDYAVGMWHTGRGWAFLRKGDAGAARASADSAFLYSRRLRGKRIANNPADTLLMIAATTLSGEILAAAGRRDEAIALLEVAVAKQDSLNYDEPPPFFYPSRHSLGAVLLEKGDVASARRAQQVYETDLGQGARYDVRRNPTNAWAYVGLARAVRIQGYDPSHWEAEARKVWRGGALPPSSRY